MPPPTAATAMHTLKPVYSVAKIQNHIRPVARSAAGMGKAINMPKAALCQEKSEPV